MFWSWNIFPEMTQAYPRGDEKITAAKWKIERKNTYSIFTVFLSETLN